MKILILLITCFSFGFLNAQNTPEQQAKNQTDRMNTNLTLNTEQYSKVYEINYGIILKNENIRLSTYTEEVKKQILKSNQDARKAMLKDVLTAAQFEKMEAKIEKAEKIEIKN